MLKYCKVSIIAFLVISSILKQSDATADSCWVGIQGGSSTAAGRSEESAAAGAPATTTGTYYTASCNTCKRTTATSTGFASFPVVTGFCVVAASDSVCTSSLCTGSAGTLAAGCTQTATVGTVTTVTFCKTAGANNAAITAAPALDSCYTAWSSTSYTGTKTGGSGEFCKSTYTVGATSSVATAVTLNGLAANAACTTGSVGVAGTPYVHCCSVNDCNSVLYCYVGAYTTSTGATTMAKTICLPTKGQFCKNDYVSGVITGTCEDTCTASATVPTSTSATGNTCCSTANCNQYPSSSESLKASMIIQFFYILTGLMMLKNN